MTLLKIYALEDTKEEDVVTALPEGEHIIGRGIILNCRDKRISRKHALINVCKDVVTIKAVHVNPCFFKAADNNNITILLQNASVNLNDGDQFSLLADRFWFRVRVIVDEVEDVLRSNDMKILRNTSRKIFTLNGSDGAIMSCFKSDKTNSHSFEAYNNDSFKNKRGLVEKFTEICKRQKTSEDHRNIEPVISTSSGKVESPKKNVSIIPMPPNRCNLLLDTSQNFEQYTRQHINSAQRIHNLNNVLDEDYGTIIEQEKVKQKITISDESTSTPNILNSNINNITQIKENIAPNEKKSSIFEQKDEYNKAKENEKVPDNKDESSADLKVNIESDSIEGQKNETGIENINVNEEKLPGSQVGKIKNKVETNNSSILFQGDIIKGDKEVILCSKDNHSEFKNGSDQKLEISNSSTLQIDETINENEEGTSQIKKNTDQNQNEASCSKNNINNPEDNLNKKSRRERCWYAHVCYRKNPLHRLNYSHPGDDDFLSDSDDDRPECPFGNECYRTNLVHRRDFKHTNRPAPKPRHGVLHRNKHRTPKWAKLIRANHDSTDDDDYDYDDPFIDDASSDEYQYPEDDEDSTDSEDSQNITESEETRRLLKEAKRFTKTKPNKD